MPNTAPMSPSTGDEMIPSCRQSTASFTNLEKLIPLIYQAENITGEGGSGAGESVESVETTSNNNYRGAYFPPPLFFSPLSGESVETTSNNNYRGVYFPPPLFFPPLSPAVNFASRYIYNPLQWSMPLGVGAIYFFATCGRPAFPLEHEF